MKIPLVGHGPFAPKGECLPRPNRECPGEPTTKGKGGRAATAQDVDFGKDAI